MPKNRFTKLALSVFIVTLLACCSCGKSVIYSNNADSINTASPLSGHPELPLSGDNFSNWKISETEAISIASQHVPEEVVNHAKILVGQGESGNINTGERHYYWVVLFTNISVTKAWLGWQSDNQTIMDAMEPYGQLTVTIDALTREFIERRANYPVYLGPSPGITPSTVILWTPSSATGTPPTQ